MKNLGVICSISTAVLLTACGGSSGGGSSTPEVASCGDQIELVFPTAYSATLSNNITVRGTADCEHIDSISVNGTAATSSDDFANWQANVSLQAGRNTLVAKITEGDKSQQIELAAIESNELIYSPELVTVTADGSTLYVFDVSRRHLLKVDVASGARSVVSSTSFPNADFAFGNVTGLALDENHQIIYLVSRHVTGIANSSQGAVLAVNLETGARSVISNPDDASSNTSFRNVDSLILDAANKRLFASSGAEIYSIELDANNTLGEQTLISSNAVPDATNPFTGSNHLTIALDSANERLIVSDRGEGTDNNEQILSVNLAAGSLGERTIISAAKDEWYQLGQLVLKDSNTAYMYERADNDAGSIYSVNLNDGSTERVLNSADQTMISAMNEYNGPLTYSAATNKLYSISDSNKSIFEISIADKNYKEIGENLASAITGFYEPLDDLSRNALDSAQQQLYVAYDDQNILNIDLKTGARKVFKSELNGGEFGSDVIESMDFDSVLDAVIITGERSADPEDIGYVKAFSRIDGAETIITDAEIDASSDFYRPWDWARINDSTGIAADDSESPTKFYEVNTTTGMRTEIVIDHGAVPERLEAEDMEISADKTTIYTTDDSDKAGLYTFNLTNKVYEIITDETTPADGNDLRLSDPESLAVASDNQHVYVGDNDLSALIKVNLETGSRQAFINDENTSTNSWAERIQGIAVDRERQVIYTSDDNAEVVLMMDEVTNEWVMIAE